MRLVIADYRCWTDSLLNDPMLSQDSCSKTFWWNSKKVQTVLSPEDLRRDLLRWTKHLVYCIHGWSSWVSADNWDIMSLSLSLAILSTCYSLFVCDPLAVHCNPFHRYPILRQRVWTESELELRKICWYWRRFMLLQPDRRHNLIGSIVYNSIIMHTQTSWSGRLW